MATFESPTVLTRRPTSVSPPLPPSPAPSRVHPRERHHDLYPMSLRGRHLLPNSGSGTSTPDWSEEQEHQDIDDAATARELSGPEPRLPKDEGRESWWRKLSKRWRLMLTLENSGSVARDHLASERTFLAYTRTSLTIASTGVALVQLFTLSAETMNKDIQRFARPLGAVMIGLGLFTLFVGVGRYFLVQDALIRGVYPVARVSTSVLSVAIFAFVIVVFVIVIVAR